MSIKLEFDNVDEIIDMVRLVDASDVTKVEEAVEQCLDDSVGEYDECIRCNNIEKYILSEKRSVKYDNTEYCRVENVIYCCNCHTELERILLRLDKI
jgi:tetrahydromethanopterin S-methyltransferase subunit A